MKANEDLFLISVRCYPLKLRVLIDWEQLQQQSVICRSGQHVDGRLLPTSLNSECVGTCTFLSLSWKKMQIILTNRNRAWSRFIEIRRQKHAHRTSILHIMVLWILYSYGRSGWVCMYDYRLWQPARKKNKLHIQSSGFDCWDGWHIKRQLQKIVTDNYVGWCERHIKNKQTKSHR